LIAGFLLVAGVLLWRYARLIEWHEVIAAIAGYPASHIAVAALASALAYAMYCSFDVLARAYTRHTLSLRRVLAIAFVCYAFILNLGGLLGGFGFRYRLYSHAGLGMANIWRVAAFAVATNWSGFLLFGGIAFLLEPVLLPQAWHIPAGGLRMAGAVMLGLLAAWLAMCALSRRRCWTVRGHDIELPSFTIALLQVVLAFVSWLSIASIIYILIPEGVSYLTVSGVLALSVLANLVIRVPANLGVLEAVFIATLGPQLGTPQVLAAVLTYRALFHIGPLLLAVIVYLLFEAHAAQRTGPGVDAG
jgi:uncharacterized membrane protein YbhN (UPF0104 family)